MRVLVTGQRALIGRALEPLLLAADHDVVGLDLQDGMDVLDSATVEQRAAGCAAVVHLAAGSQVSGPLADGPLAAVRGTANVLRAAERHRMRRVVLVSSVEVVGCFAGTRAAGSLPVDDAAPAAPSGELGWSMLAAEELLAAFTRAVGVPTVSLRAPVVRPVPAEGPVPADGEAPAAGSPARFGAFIDVRDLASACQAALTTILAGHHRMLVNAPDVGSLSEPSLELARRLHGDVPIIDRERFARDPFAALVDSGQAEARLGWRPIHRLRRTS